MLPLNNPLHNAESYAMVDVLSNGRVEVGVGRGATPEEFKGFGIDYDDSPQRLREHAEEVCLSRNIDILFRSEGAESPAKLGIDIRRDVYLIFKEAVNNALRLPYFVKPANTGSSVGVVKVKNDDALGPAIENAFRFDEKALVERGIDARELEVALLGNDDAAASVAGEIIPAESTRSRLHSSRPAQ